MLFRGHDEEVAHSNLRFPREMRALQYADIDRRKAGGDAYLWVSEIRAFCACRTPYVRRDATGIKRECYRRGTFVSKRARA